MPDEFRAIQNVDIVGVLATPLARTRQRQVDLVAERAHPADLPGRRSDHHRPIPRAFGKGRSGRQERADATGHVRNNGRIGTEGRTGPHQGLPEDGVSIDGGARKRNMGEDHVGRAEDEVFQLHVRKDRDRISQPARVADNGVALDVGILAQTANFSPMTAPGATWEKYQTLVYLPTLAPSSTTALGWTKAADVSRCGSFIKDVPLSSALHGPARAQDRARPAGSRLERRGFSI